VAYCRQFIAIFCLGLIICSIYAPTRSIHLLWILAPAVALLLTIRFLYVIAGDGTVFPLADAAFAAVSPRAPPH
jgi:hypothetical protein